MKLYKFYKRISDEARANCTSNESIEDMYPLEAFTNDKSLRNRFKEERDMSQYIEIKTEVTKDEYVAFANNDTGKKLDIYTYEHKRKYASYDDDTDGCVCDNMEILSTWFEREVVESYEDALCDESLFTLFPLVFKPKYIKALSKLEYMSFWALISDKNRYISVLTPDELEELDEMVYSIGDTQFDRFAIFIELFGDKFKL